MARRLGVEQPNVHRWRSGAVRPSKAAIKGIAATFGLSENELLGGAVKEDPAHYGPKLSRAEQRALDIFDELMKSGDKEITSHLERQINLLYDLYQTRQRRGHE